MQRFHFYGGSAVARQRAGMQVTLHVGPPHRPKVRHSPLFELLVFGPIGRILEDVIAFIRYHFFAFRLVLSTARANGRQIAQF